MCPTWRGSCVVSSTSPATATSGRPTGSPRERRERHLPAFARTLGREEAALDAIVRGLLKPAGAEQSTIAAVKTLVDFAFWQALTANGTPKAAAPAVMHRLVLAELAAAGLI